MGELEENSLWYKYKSAVWPVVSEPSHTAHNITKVLRAIHNLNGLAYLSVPITSGKILYDTLNNTLFSNQTKYFLTGSESTGTKIKGVPKFKEIIDSVIYENYGKGRLFLEDLLKKLNKPILYPADLYPRGERWKQEHFQALWLTLISEKCSELYMADDWEFSNGGSEEFVHAYQLKLGVPEGTCGKGSSPFFNTREGEEKSRERMKNIQIYDSKGKIISIEEGISALNNSIGWVKKQGFNSETLENSRRLLEWTENMIKRKFYQ